ncbi:hypothetical protein [Citrobacter werkmanii]|uniref:hypothetical protein n=1 Tax=Citrobacter werkmanii TaxID=67827 RepID=UPI0032B50F7F
MKNIYLLRSTSRNTCSFIQDYPEGERSIIGRSMMQDWKPFEENYHSVTLELRRNYSGKRNYQFDFSSALNPFLVVSEDALNKLKDIFEPRGQILPVITKSKKKNFFGYYPTNPLSGCFNMDESVYRVAERGLIIEKPVLIASNITDEYLFSIDEDISRVFVTDKFKKRVEEAGLLGFDFSVEIPTT